MWTVQAHSKTSSAGGLTEPQYKVSLHSQRHVQTSTSTMPLSCCMHFLFVCSFNDCERRFSTGHGVPGLTQLCDQGGSNKVLPF